MAGADTSTPIRRRKRSAGCAVTRAVKAAGTVAIPAMTSRRLMSTSPSMRGYAGHRLRVTQGQGRPVRLVAKVPFDERR
jgi:hypothetical protein